MNWLLDMLRPDDYVERVTDIDYLKLKAEGIDVIIIDMDNTLLPWRSFVIPEDVREWVRAVRSVGIKLVILSNTHCSRRLSKIASELGMPCVSHAMKPWRLGFRKAAKLADCRPDAAAVVGDQLLTDIVGGNLCGMKTILVSPMHPHEFVGTKLSRLIERGILSLLRLAPGEGTKSARSQSERQDTR